MRVLPILFNTDMVKAVMDGQKTATRRAVKYKYSNTEMEMFTNKYGTRLVEIEKDIEGKTYGKKADGGTWRKVRGYIEPKPPYRTGDILYIRETWANYNPNECCEVCRGQCGYHGYIYKADYNDPDIKWRPSIHMPKSAARIWLKVTDVRVERLKDITIPDMIKEGIRAFGCEPCLELNGRCKPQTSEDGFCGAEDQAEDMFSELWDSTIKKPDLDNYGWKANPWVWVIEFKRCEKLEV